MLGILALVTTVVCAQALPTEEVQGLVTSLHFDSKERIARDGYYSESHLVTTSDGYILEVNRIPFGRHERGDTKHLKKPVVFLMHGLQGSALSYITLGADTSLAYNLADEGYDVWMGNSRGALNSRQHVTLNPDDKDDVKDFFDYTFEDIGMKDLPAMIDYVLEVTKQDKLHYVGHSQGGTSFLVLNSMLPEYNDKIISANLLAGVGYMNHFPNQVLRIAAYSTNAIYAFALRVGLIELIGPNWNDFFLGECTKDDEELCLLLIIREIMADVLGPLEVMAGASIKQYAHYGQNISAKRFRRWYFDPITNLFRYGSFTPPDYDISKITIETTMHYSMNDILLDERDVLDMAEAMPNTRARRIARDSFTHTDFVVARDAKELVYDNIIENLKKYK